MQIRRVIKFEFDGGHDVEFMRSRSNVWEVWVDGVFIEELRRGERPSAPRAWYYWEVHCPQLEALMRAPADPAEEQGAVLQ
jgi:hypothetical protein